MDSYKNNAYKAMVSGFSKMSKPEKMAWMVKHFFTTGQSKRDVIREFASFWHSNVVAQKIFDDISENVVTNYYLPYSVAPNFLINQKVYCVPMVIEESSVVAAASSAAKFWYKRGGFKAEVISTTKIGHVHFLWQGDPVKLYSFFNEIKSRLFDEIEPITCNMNKRGGGVLDLKLKYLPDVEKGYYQLEASFETCDAMGANFINSVLEALAKQLTLSIANYTDFEGDEREVTIIMAILSNYTPECLVRSWVSCPIEDLGTFPDDMSAETFAYKFCQAIHIAKHDSYRATTHNKGIFNGIDAVVLATGNDFRAIEACGHTYACRNGSYASLSDCKIEGDQFTFSLDIPLAVGTVGGLTKLHPLAKRSLELLGSPTAKELMQIIASVGLAQNFAAVRSLVTTGIQKGHMKMHLNNILNTFNVTEAERTKATQFFADKTVSFSAVREFVEELRKEALTI